MFVCFGLYVPLERKNVMKQGKNRIKEMKKKRNIYLQIFKFVHVYT